VTDKLAAWVPNKWYNEGDLVYENDGEAFECLREGRSGLVKPEFPVNSRVVVSERDRTVMWRGYPRMNRKAQ